MERDFYIYGVDMEVIMEEPSDEEKDGDVWASLMQQYVGHAGTITDRQNWEGRPLYLVDFGTNDWWCEEQWLRSVSCI